MTKKILGALVAVLLISLAAWFGYRVSVLGFSNAFSREYRVRDSRPLTEEMAIEVSRNALQFNGYDVADLEPVVLEVAFHPDYPNDRIFARNRYVPDDGRVVWRPRWVSNQPSASHVEYRVNIERKGDELRCRVFLPK
jgi:hypothetical protein